MKWQGLIPAIFFFYKPIESIFTPKIIMSLLSVSNEKALKTTFYITTVAVCALVTVLNQKWIPHPDVFPNFIYKLPALNALLNGSCSILLLFFFMGH